MLSYFSCVRPLDPVNCSLPGSSVHGILQARILEWVAMPSSRRSSLTQGLNLLSCVVVVFSCCSVWWYCSVAQSCLTLCDSMDCSPPGPSVHGTFQARILEWVAMPSSKESSQPRNRKPCLLHCRWILYPLSNLGSWRVVSTSNNITGLP